MAKTVFKNYMQGQISLFPARLDEKIPLDSPTRPVNHREEGRREVCPYDAGVSGGGLGLVR